MKLLEKALHIPVLNCLQEELLLVILLTPARQWETILYQTACTNALLQEWAAPSTIRQTATSVI